MAVVEVEHRELKQPRGIKRSVFSLKSILSAVLVVTIAYLLFEPQIVSDSPIFRYTVDPYVTDLKGTKDPAIRPGDTLVAHFEGEIRRECQKVTYLRHFIRVQGDFERIEKVPALDATYVRPGDYSFSVSQVTPPFLYTGRWVWRAIELAECYRGVVWRSHRDMPFIVIGPLSNVE